MLGREQVVARLELLVVGRGSETEASGVLESWETSEHCGRSSRQNKTHHAFLLPGSRISKFLIAQSLQEGHVDVEGSNDPLLLARC
eukprot:6731088-Pyramimonas_sp.AAC.1